MVESTVPSIGLGLWLSLQFMFGLWLSLQFSL